MKRILHDELPEDNYYVLKYVISFLVEVSVQIKDFLIHCTHITIQIVRVGVYFSRMEYKSESWLLFSIQVVSFLILIRHQNSFKS